jgi:hypothetical protein
MKVWCEFENVLTDDTKSRNYCVDCRHVECKTKGVFYCSDSPWTSQSAKVLWSLIFPYKPSLLCRSVVGMKFWMHSQRQTWCRRELDLDPEIFVYTSKKELIKYANDGDILITRSVFRKSTWEAEGGLCFLFDDTLEVVNSIGAKIRSIMSITTQELHSCTPALPTEHSMLPITSDGLTLDPNYELCCIACHNFLFIVLGTEYEFQWTGTDCCDNELYDMSKVFRELCSCKYCLVQWAVIYMQLHCWNVWTRDLQFSVGNFCSRICADLDITCVEDSHNPCSSKDALSQLQSSDMQTLEEYDANNLLINTPHLRLLHLLVLNYCVGFRPHYVLTRVSTTAEHFVGQINSESIERVSLGSVFVNCEHLCCYRNAVDWRNRVSSWIVEGRKSHKRAIACQWDGLIAGEDGASNPPYSHRDVDIELCIDEVLSGWRLTESDESGGDDEVCGGSIPSFVGLAVAWTDYSLLSQEFCQSRLYHFLPLWNVVCGLMDCVGFLEQRAGWKKKRFTDNRWKNDYRMCVGILRLLLRPPAPSVLAHATQSCLEARGHIDAMLTSVRGKCWVHLLTCLRGLGGSKAEMDVAVHNALDACGQLRTQDGGGGMTAADVEEIELFAASYRAVICKKTRDKNKKQSRGGRKKNITESSASPSNHLADDATPPKRYIPPLAHFQRVFRGRLVRRRRHTSVEEHRSKRKRLIYEKASRADADANHIVAVAYADDVPVSEADAAVSLNDRWQGMIVEKFALCRYLSLIASSSNNTPDEEKQNSQLSNSDVELDLYSTSVGRDLNKPMHLSDFLETSKGPGAWVHGRVRLRAGAPATSSGACSLATTQEWLASYCEGTVWLTLLVLVLWEEIYDPSLPLSMMRDFMDRPIDLLPERHYQNSKGSPIRSDGFYQRRRYSINAKLQKIRRLRVGELREMLVEALQMHSGSHCFAVSWSKVDSDLVVSTGCALGGVRLADIIEEMIRDPVCYSRGMPDLLFCAHHNSIMGSRKQYGHETDDDADCKPWFRDYIFVSEVKSPHDKLSIWQKLWIRLFEKTGVPFEECKVT